MGTGDLCQVPSAAAHPGRARQCSGTEPCGYCRRVLWVPVPRGQYSGKIRFIEKHGVQDGGGVAMWLNVILTRVAYPGQCLGTGPSAFWVLLPGFTIRGKFVLSIGQAKSSILALSYFQVGDLKHDQELYAKVSYIPSA